VAKKVFAPYYHHRMGHSWQSI